jgi:hypothetical protein
MSDEREDGGQDFGREVLFRLGVFGILFTLFNGLYGEAGQLLAALAAYEISIWATIAWRDRAIRRLMEKRDRLRGDRPS